ncbi:MAG: Na(+)-translocating NADH-quinone reductase subunit C [Cellvibrionaceae bacterium]
MSNNDSIQKTFIVAFVLCIVCSIVVSTAAVMLKPAQIANKAKDFKVNILKAGGLYKQGIADGKSIDEIFEGVTIKVVDLDTGKYTDAVDVDSYDQRKAGKDPKLSDALSADNDLAKISSREKYSKVYLINDGDEVKKVILPVKGYGLWSTMYGFISLEPDLNTVSGLTFYEHGETPGLGGEIDNPGWKAIWPGKKIYKDDSTVALTVIKGQVNNSTPEPEYKVDGLSGATLTSKGVDNLVKFWMGEMGYAKFLTNLKSGEA